jgi:tRNA1Val (adenine37-N6)-methyltransferase
VPTAEIVGIEKRKDAYERSVEACSLNSLESRVSFLNCDILDIDGKHDFDAVVSNPPYFRRSAGVSETGSVRLESDDKYVARHETTATIGDFAKTASSMLVRGGSLYLVHRPDRLVDIFTEMRSAGIEPKEIQMVAPSHGKAANIVLIHGIKDAGPQLTILPEIAVHTENGGYTDVIMDIYERPKSKRQKKYNTIKND